MRRLLDTSVCVEILRGRHAHLKVRLRLARNGNVFVSSVVVAELHYGVARTSDPVRNAQRLRAFLRTLPSLAFDDAAAERYGRLRAALEAAGTPIGPNDLLIAATALANDLTLVTNNLGEFSRVPDLQVESWA